MRHRLVVLAAVLAVAGLAACGRDKDDRPAPQPQIPVAGGSAHPGMSFTALPSTGTNGTGTNGTGTNGAGTNGAGTNGAGPSGRPTAAGPVTGITDPAGAAIGRPQTLPAGNEISATGIGPYTIGQEQAALSTAKLVGPVKPGSTGCDTGTGQAKWGSPALIFTKGKLQHVRITAGSVRTTGGIQVGAADASVRRAYPKGSALSARGATAWLAPTGDFALLFRITGGKVAAIESGPASTLPFTFTDNQNC
jgi:hypothetical protein